MTGLLACLHVRYFLRAGALWRDEANTVSLSALGSVGELWENLQYDSFPLLWHLVLRAFRLAGMGETDASLRGLGLVVGLGLAGALWLASRSLGAGAPVVSLPLLGLGAAVIAYGDSLRGYGLGMTTGVLAFALVWGVVESPRPLRVLVALLASLAAVHSLFHNAVVVAASVLAGSVVCVRRGEWKRAATVAGIGLLAGLSTLPYLGPISQAREWNVTVKAPVSLGSLGAKLFETLALSGAPVPWLWLAMVILSIALALLVQAPAPGPEGEDSRADRADHADRALYGAVALVAGAAGYAAFLLLLSYPTQPWYYLALLGLGAVCVETCLSVLPRGGAGSALRVLAGAALVAVAIPQAWQAAGARRTNVDLVAARIEREARRGDLVVVSPWYLGVSFDRYYRGAAPWITVPPIPFHAFHRYDLLQREMAKAGAMEPVLLRLRTALASGGRVFWVGDPPAERPAGADAAQRPGAPEGAWVGADGPYYELWGGQAAEALRSLSAGSEPMEVEVGQPVNPYEDAGLVLFRSRPASP